MALVLWYWNGILEMYWFYPTVLAVTASLDNFFYCQHLYCQHLQQSSYSIIPMPFTLIVCRTFCLIYPLQRKGNVVINRIWLNRQSFLYGVPFFLPCGVFIQYFLGRIRVPAIAVTPFSGNFGQ